MSQGKFRWGGNERFFTETMVSHWNRAPRLLEFMESLNYSQLCGLVLYSPSRSRLLDVMILTGPLQREILCKTLVVRWEFPDSQTYISSHYHGGSPQEHYILYMCCEDNCFMASKMASCLEFLVSSWCSLPEVCERLETFKSFFCCS